jgi:hypothetical protein
MHKHGNSLLRFAGRGAALAGGLLIGSANLMACATPPPILPLDLSIVLMLLFRLRL